MPSTYNKFYSFVGGLVNGVYNLSSDTIKIMLSNTAPSASNVNTADITQISGTNGYTTNGTAVGSFTVVDSSGTVTASGNSVVFTAATGAMGPLRYAVLYDATVASQNLIAWWDYGSSISPNVGETFTVSFPSNIFTLS